MRGLASAFIDSAFGRDAQGRALFMPFGMMGAQYRIADARSAARLRLGVACMMPLALCPMIGVLLLCVLPRSFWPGREATHWLFIGGSFLAFFALFTAWAFVATRGMDRVDAAARSLPDLLDPEQDVIRRLLHRFQPPRTLCIAQTLGVLGGFACQMVLRGRAQQAGLPAPLIELATIDGRLRYFGDALNGRLAEEPDSLWAILGDGAPATDLAHHFRDMTDACVGDDPEYAALTELLQRHWTSTARLLQQRGILLELWPGLFARSMQQWLADRDGDDAAAVQTFMRAAIGMSKIDPAEILVPDTTPAPVRRSPPMSRTRP